MCNTYATDADGSFPITVEVKDLSMESLKYKVNGSAKTTTLLFEYKVGMQQTCTCTRTIIDQ